MYNGKNRTLRKSEDIRFFELGICEFGETACKCFTKNSLGRKLFCLNTLYEHKKLKVYIFV